MAGWLKHDPAFTTDSRVSTDGKWRYIVAPGTPHCGVAHHDHPDQRAHCGRLPHPIGGPHILVADELIDGGIRLDRARAFNNDAAPDPLAYPSEKAEADARQLAMLRVTLAERIENIRMELATARYRTGSDRWCADLAFLVFAYQDVLSLLGPEEPDAYDPGAPF